MYQNTNFIKGKNFSGYIFDSEKFALVSIENQVQRYTPTKEDICLAEKLLAKQIKDINKDQLNQTDGCPKIHKNLSKYVRQYVGFINDKQQKVIWINFIWENEISDKKLQEDIIQSYDGCSYYWNVTVNLNNTQFYDLNVNGKG